MLKPVAVVLAMCAFPASFAATPACVGDSPVSVTRWVWKHRPGLAAPDSRRFITADFLAAIGRDTARARQNDEICGLCGGALWTNSQEGYARPPRSFKQSMRNGDTAQVDYSFRFSIGRSGPSEPRSTRIVLRREQACWKIDDMVHDGVSLKSVLHGHIHILDSSDGLRALLLRTPGTIAYRSVSRSFPRNRQHTYNV